MCAEGIVRGIRTCEQLGGAHSEVGVIEWYLIGTLAADHHLELIGIGLCNVHLVIDGDCLVDSGERMVSIGSRSTHLQGEIDLGRYSYAYAGGSRRRR